MTKEDYILEAVKDFEKSFPDLTIEKMAAGLLAVVIVTAKGKQKKLDKIFKKVSKEFPNIYLMLEEIEEII